MSAMFEVVRFEVEPVDELQPHRDAEMPIAEEDFRALVESVKDQGAVLQPLLAVEHASGTLLVVDGCNRLAAAREAGLAQVPVAVVRTGDVRALALECMTTGRKRSAGQRIYAFVAQHWAEIEAWRRSEEALGGRPETKPVSRGTGFDFSENAIVKHLGCSKQDVAAAIELRRCICEKTRPETCVRGLPVPLDEEDEEDARYEAAMLEFEREVLCGEARPLRKWKAAVGGKARTEGRTPQPKGPVKVIDEELNRLKAVLGKHWPLLDNDEHRAALRMTLERACRPIYREEGRSAFDQAVHAVGVLASVYERQTKLTADELRRLEPLTETLQSLTFSPKERRRIEAARAHQEAFEAEQLAEMARRKEEAGS